MIAVAPRLPLPPPRIEIGFGSMVRSPRAKESSPLTSRQRMVRTLTALILLGIAFVKDVVADDTILAEGRARSEAFLRGDMSEIWDAMTPKMRDALGDQ